MESSRKQEQIKNDDDKEEEKKEGISKNESNQIKESSITVNIEDDDVKEVETGVEKKSKKTEKKIQPGK